MAATNSAIVCRVVALAGVRVAEEGRTSATKRFGASNVGEIVTDGDGYT